MPTKPANGPIGGQTVTGLSLAQYTRRLINVSWRLPAQPTSNRSDFVYRSLYIAILAIDV